MHSLLIRASMDIGKLAADYVHSPSFARRVTGGAGALLRRIADRDAPDESDLLSYLLFDGEFAQLLIDLGRADARALHEDLCRFFHEAIEEDA